MPQDSSRSAPPLCLACSSSLPPRLWKQTLKSTKSGDGPSLSGGRSNDSVRRLSSELFLTLCCGRPICPSCVTSNPRLVRYNPCLACLGGVSAVRAEKVLRGQHQVAASNVDGAVRDEDVFIVGDEDEDEASEMHDGQATKIPGGIQPPSEVAKPLTLNISVKPTADPNQSDTDPDSNQGSPGRYYIRPDDTLLGISLRLGVDGRTLCKLNDLPPSTLHTTPHLLHTRTFLILPQSHPQQHANDTNDVSPEKAAQRERARAQVAFQRVTKETDDGVAQAYVAVAAEDSESGSDVLLLKAEGEKVVSGRVVGRTIEERAVDRYLDDDEWERRERAEGRGVHIQRLPATGNRAIEERRAEKVVLM